RLPTGGEPAAHTVATTRRSTLRLPSQLDQTARGARPAESSDRWAVGSARRPGAGVPLPVRATYGPTGEQSRVDGVAPVHQLPRPHHPPGAGARTSCAVIRSPPPARPPASAPPPPPPRCAASAP